jgi:uracil-DNA glycosylase
MLWGKFAQSKAALINKKKHLILQAPHPSPFSAHTGFFGCKHFSKCNKYLQKHGGEKINW